VEAVQERRRHQAPRLLAAEERQRARVEADVVLPPATEGVEGAGAGGDTVVAHVAVHPHPPRCRPYHLEHVADDAAPGASPCASGSGGRRRRFMGWGGARQ